MDAQPQSWLSNNIKCILSVMVVLLTFAYFFVCFITSAKPDPQILIAVVGANGIVLNYWFGSSSGSSKKDSALVASIGQPTFTQTGDSPTTNLTNSPVVPQPPATS